MDFGSRNSPSSFIRLAQFFSSGLLYELSIPYMDDVVVASKTLEGHLDDLEAVFKRLEYYRLWPNMEICRFAR